MSIHLFKMQDNMSPSSIGEETESKRVEMSPLEVLRG